ncbi:MAG: helix-turn-helix domain-containing protein [Sphaerochaetaceae bacterium]|nr:helix-turn-helix domain-containing protein [Sphaerochaetaceae bacterium]
MNQVEIGSFLRLLRKEKGLTQEQLAEKFNVASRTISRWENGSNMPDLSILVELADFYDVDIREIIDGERKGEKMDSEVKDTLVKVAEYGDIGKKIENRKLHQIIGGILAVFGLFIIISAFAIFPTDSSWGSIYSFFGCVIFSVAIYKLCPALKITKILPRLACSVACFIIIFLCLCGLDYLGVKNFDQPPRFCYEKSYGSDCVEYKTLFYSVTRYNVDADNEYYVFD